VTLALGGGAVGEKEIATSVGKVNRVSALLSPRDDGLWWEDLRNTVSKRSRKIFGG